MPLGTVAWHQAVLKETFTAGEVSVLCPFVNKALDSCFRQNQNGLVFNPNRAM